MREGMAEAVSKRGYVYKYDLSLPLDHYYELVAIMRDRLSKKALVVGYGHVGDANLHLNIATPEFDQEILDEIEPFVFDFTASKGGSVSAEHGIGSAKVRYLTHSKSNAAVEVMRSIKATLDPNHILNPYKLFHNSQ